MFINAMSLCLKKAIYLCLELLSFFFFLFLAQRKTKYSLALFLAVKFPTFREIAGVSISGSNG